MDASREVSSAVSFDTREKSLRAWVKSLFEGTTIDSALARRADNFLALRIIAAAMVIYGHAPRLAPAVLEGDFFVNLGWGIYSGDIAVYAFFFISGFLVTGSYARRGNLFAFAKARFLRVYPAFLVNVVGLALIYGLVFTALPKWEYLQNAQVWSYITTNLKMSSSMAWTLPGVFDQGMKTSTLNGSQWSMPAEVRMYALLAVLGGLGALSSRALATIIGCGLILLGVFRPDLLPLHEHWFAPAGYFVLGVLVYLYRGSIRVRIDLVVAALLLAVLTHQLAMWRATFGLALGGGILGLAYLVPPLKWLEKFGDPSYGIYLWGWPCQQLVASFVPYADRFLHVALSFALALTVGYVSWHVFEKRALRLR